MKARPLLFWVLAYALVTATAGHGAPGIETVLPPAGSALRELRVIEVHFAEPVRGVDASDLLINEVEAAQVMEFGPGQFVFSFSQPNDGPVLVTWRSDHGITDRESPATAFAGDSWSYQLDSQNPSAAVILSEFMADNRKTLPDEDGDASDWIELFNGDEVEVDLDGWFLTDDPGNLAKWRFPAVTMAPGEFLVIFASEKNRTNPPNRLHTNFKLAAEGEYLALVSPRGHILSEFAPRFPPQRTDVSYGRARGDEEVLGYFTRPTPGAANADSGPGFAPEARFSQPSGTFVQPFELVLSTGSSNAVLRYTLDGSVPTNSSPAYLAPIPVTNSVQVRARTFENGLLPGPPRTETYVLLHENLVTFASDLPVLVIHSLGKGAPSASRQNFAHLSVYEPVRGMTSLTNAPTLVSRTGIKLRGSSTEGMAKSSFALELWDEFNQDQKREVLGLPAESDWVLYAPNVFDPVLIHNPFVHQVSRDMGRYSSRTRFVEIYLNKTTGPVGTAQYHGIYVLEERIKIGPDRVAIDRLKPEHVREPEVTGGYLLKIDRLDPGDSGFTAGGQRICYVDPKEREIKLLQRDPQEQYIKSYLTQFSLALNGTNWLDPHRGYAAYIDVPAWIDFHVLELLSGNVDALVLSTYFHKPRQGKIVFGPHWDFDRALGSTDGRDSNPRNWVTGPFFTGWWGRLFRDPSFWQQWIDRYQELRGSHFSHDHLFGLIDRLADEVRQAQPRERQKWRVTLRGGSYQSEVDRMKAWLSNRMDFIDKQLVPAPRLSAAGGRVSSGFELTLTGPTNATLFYTLDGSDPRLEQGGISPQAHAYTAPLILRENARVVARARNLAQRQTGGPPISSPWSGPVAATFSIAPPALLVTELMWHPAGGEPASIHSAGDFEFIELKNVSAEPVQLAGCRFTGGIEFNFTSGSHVTSLAPGERVLIVRDAAAFEARYPGVGNVAGEFIGSLGQHSRQVTLIGPMQETVFDFTYENTWQPLADGFGFSLVLADENVPPDALGNPAAWRLSAQVGGSPGERDPPPPDLPPVLVNELVTNPLPGQRDTLELFNPGPGMADLSGWFLTDDFRTPKKLRLPDGVLIEPGGYLLFDSFPLADGSFSFSKFGEQVYLFSADASGTLTGWCHGFPFGAAEEGVSFGRHVTSTGEEVFVAQARPTPGTINSGPRVGPILISEILADTTTAWPGNPSVEAYIELWNSSPLPVPLHDPAHPAHAWRVRGAADFDFPAGTILAGHNYLVLVSFDPQTDVAALAHFRSRYGLDNHARLFGPWRGGLGGSGVVRLLKPGPPQSQPDPATFPRVLVEQVIYSVGAPWPVRAEPALALTRRGPDGFADDPAHWLAALPSPGDGDWDGDGLPDAWEVRYGFDPTSALGEDGRDGDPDGDGFSNAQEFLSGTDPRDPSDWLRLEILAMSGQGVTFWFPVTPGRSYTLQYRDSLSQGSWRNLRNFISPPGAESLSVTDRPGSGPRFYRVTCP